ncbi:hypothetical protein G6514_009189 [Epicoccum nigrum]|nr:hypothetical protein G6514_009189 [Epicoccum nigrum]
MAPARDDEFLPEVWGLYSLGTLWLVLRCIVRIRVDGIKGLRLDDALACIVLFAWTYTCAIIQITYYTGTSSDFTPEEVAKFDQKKFAEVEYGSKLFLGSCLVLIFTLKGIVLVFYQRIFHERWQKWVLWITTALCVAGLLLSVPVSLLWNLNKPLRTRIAVFVLLASGLFVLAACITRVSLTVVPDIFVLNIARWGVREFCIAIVAVNSASLRPMFRRSFWTTRSPTPEVQQRRHNYVFPSAQRVRQHFNRSRPGDQALNSTSAGASTIDSYIQRELGEQEFVFEDPDYQMSSHIPPPTAPDFVVGAIDLEKGEMFPTHIARKDSAMPRLEDRRGSRGGSASSGDTRSSQSRR